MKIKDLKKYFNELPDKYDDCEVVYRDYMTINERLYSQDTEIVTIFIDDNTKELCMLCENSRKTLDEHKIK